MNDAARQRCILLVEDEMCLALMLEELLEDAGYAVLKAARLPAALALAKSAAIDAAMLDINLAGTEVFPAAEALRQRGIPFVFTSGYGRNGLPPEFLQSPMLQKPYDQALVQQALARLISDGEAATAPARS